MDSNEIYDEVWAKEYTKIFNMNISHKSPLQIIKTGSCHTITLNSKGRVFTWGWNNYGQCGQPMYTSYKNNFALPEVYRDKKGNIQNIPTTNYLHSGRSLNIDGFGPVKSVTCGDDHSFLIDENGNAFAFGNNSKGQLGLGNIWEIEKPQLITSLKGKVKEIHSSGDLNLAVTYDNELYIWPFENYKKNYIPMRMYLDHKITIHTISCGKNFAVILSKQGILYSFGKNNKSGELGLGDYKQRLSPETIYSLADSGEKIVQISCGFKHTIAKGSTGKVFTWGNNCDGQLGVGNFKNSADPISVNFEKLYPNRVKVMQVSAGFRSSFFFLENRHITCSGTSGLIKRANLPKKFSMDSQTPEISDDNSFAPLRILNCWNKSFSIFYCTFGDIRTLSSKLKNKQKLQIILNTLSSKWDSESIDAPYIDSIAGYFYPSFMKKKEEKKPTKKGF